VAAAWLVAASLAFAGAVAPPLGTLPGLLLSAVCTSLGLAFLALAGASLSACGPARRLGWVASGLPPRVLAGLVLGMLALSQLAEWVIELAGLGGQGTLGEFDRIVSAARGAPLGAAVLGFALLPGVCEELALRGWLQRGLEPRLGGAAAVVLGAAAFGVLHADPVHASGAFVLGLYLGTVAWWAGSIRPAVLCHVVNNGVATAGAAAEPGAPVTGVLLAAGLVAGPWALGRLWRRRAAARPGPDSGPGSGERPSRAARGTEDAAPAPSDQDRGSPEAADGR